jgi:hypothetical protein
MTNGLTSRIITPSAPIKPIKFSNQTDTADGEAVQSPGFTLFARSIPMLVMAHKERGQGELKTSRI